MPIFSNIQEIQAHTDVSVGIFFEAVKPIIEEVHIQYLSSVLPLPLYNTLANIDPNNDAVSNIYKELRKKLQAAMAKLIVANYATKSEVSLTQSGLQRTESTERKSGYRYQTAAFVKTYKSAGLAMLDQLLQYCVANATAIDEWKNSEQYKSYSLLLIKNGTEFTQLLHLPHPQLTYQKLAIEIEDVEQILMPKMFGNNYGIYKKRMSVNNLSIEEEALLKPLKKAVAYAAMTRAIPKLSLSVDAEGIISIGMEDNRTKENSKTDSHTLEKYQRNIESTALEYLDIAKNQFSAIVAANTNNAYNTEPVAIPKLKLIDNIALKGTIGI